jgi:hypothetical protein
VTLQYLAAGAAAALAAALVPRAYRAISARSRGAELRKPGGQPRGEELAAICAAAIAAATGAEPGSFRVVGIAEAPASGSPAFAGRGLAAVASAEGLVRPAPRLAARAGLNTPAWGYVDRFARGASE